MSVFYLCVVSSRLTYPLLRHPRQILQFPAVKMSDSYLDKTKVVSVIYYSHNSSRYISPVCAVSGPLPVNITRHIELCMLCYLLIHLRCFAKQRMTEFGVWTISTGCPKKNVVSWKNSHNYPQTHPKCKCWGCIGKFRIFATTWALRFSKLKKKWLRKWNLKLPTPPQKLIKLQSKTWCNLDLEFCPFLEGGGWQL